MRYRGLIAIVLALICSLPAVSQDADAPADNEAPKSATQFYRALHVKGKASYDDGLRIMQVLVEGRNSLKPFAEMAQDLKDRGVIPSGWNYDENSPISVGMICYMLVEVLEIEGGVSLMLFGNSERYAARECMHIGLVKQANTDRYITGPELLGILRRAQQYQKTN
jgi:hypothetical protein